MLWEEPPQGPPDFERLYLASDSFCAKKRRGDGYYTGHLVPVKGNILAESKRESGRVGDPLADKNVN